MLLQNGADLTHRTPFGMYVSHYFITATVLNSIRSLAESMYLTGFWNPHSLPCTHDIFEEIRHDVMLAPYHQLVIDGAVEQLQLYLEYNPGMVSFRDHYGFTLLHWAVLCSVSEVIRVILDAGADVNARSKTSETVLMWAMSSVQSARICQTLIQAGADLELQDVSGRTALHHAVAVSSSPDPDTIEILLRAGANANHVDRFGFSVLLEATNLASGSDIELLLAYGADINATDTAGMSVLDYAIIDAKGGVLAVLLAHSASTNNHWTDEDGEYSGVIFSAARCGDVATMRLLTEAHLTDIAMEGHSSYNYWYWFDTRPPPLIGEGDPPEALESAFAALLQSVTPREIKRTLRGPRIRSNPIPGAFPVDETEDSEDDGSEDGSDDTKHENDEPAGTESDSGAGDIRDTDDVGIYSGNDWMRRPTVSQPGSGDNGVQEARARHSSV